MSNETTENQTAEVAPDDEMAEIVYASSVQAATLVALKSFDAARAVADAEQEDRPALLDALRVSLTDVARVIEAVAESLRDMEPTGELIDAISGFAGWVNGALGDLREESQTKKEWNADVTPAELRTRAEAVRRRLGVFGVHTAQVLDDLAAEMEKEEHEAPVEA